MSSEALLAGLLRENIPGVIVDSKKDLPYRVNLDPNEKPKIWRYKVDVLITEDTERSSDSIGLPLVVVELKNYSKSEITTHDILSYTTKALNHKDLYPHLRYGLLYVSPVDKVIPRRVLSHNSGFDFAAVIPNLNETTYIEQFSNIIREQIECARLLNESLEGRVKARYFSNTFLPGEIE